MKYQPIAASLFIVLTGLVCLGQMPAQPPSRLVDQTRPTTFPADVDAQLAQELIQIDARASAIRTLSANFVQTRQTAMLKRPLISKGLVRSVGNIVRWDTTVPDPTVLYADNRDLRIYYPQQKLEEIYPIESRLADLLASPLPRLDAIKSHFRIERGSPPQSAVNRGAKPQSSAGINGLLLRLAPIDAELQKHVQEIIVLIDPTTGILQMVQSTDADGDQTTMEFSNIQANQPLDKAALELKVPEGTQISMPLQGVSGKSNQ